MSTPEETPFTGVLEDLAVFRACLTTNTTVTPTVVEGVWSWFEDIDINLPLGVMPMEDGERTVFAATIIDEMLDLFRMAESIYAEAPDEADIDEIVGTEIRATDSLWRELAGCYSTIINSQIAVLTFESIEDEAEMYSTVAESLAVSLDVTPDEVRTAAVENSSFRLMVRRAGIDPDRIR